MKVKMVNSNYIQKRAKELNFYLIESHNLTKRDLEEYEKLSGRKIKYKKRFIDDANKFLKNWMQGPNSKMYLKGNGKTLIEI